MPTRNDSDNDMNRSPERARLRAAIERCGELRSRIDTLTIARNRAEQDLRQSRDETSTAEALITEARSKAQRDYVARLLHGSGDDTDLVGAAQQKLDEAQRKMALGGDAVALLDHDLAELQKSLVYASDNLKSAIADVLRHEAKWLDAELTTAKERLISLHAIKHLIWSVNGLMPQDQAHAIFAYSKDGTPIISLSGIKPDQDLLNKWHAALKELEASPDAVLPKPPVTKIQRMVIDPPPRHARTGNRVAT